MDLVSATVGHPTPAEPTPARPEADAPPSADLRAEPTADECLGEWEEFHKALEANRIDPEGDLIGRHIAYYDGQLRGDDADPNVLRARVAAELGVHPERIVVSYRCGYPDHMY